MGLKSRKIRVWLMKFDLTLFEPGFSPTLKDWGGGGKLAHRRNSSILNQMKLKLGSNIVWVMFYLKFVKKLITSSFLCFYAYGVIVIFMTRATLKF